MTRTPLNIITLGEGLLVSSFLAGSGDGFLASTRELIERIKEIQNKIFKRTGRQSSAKKLKEMSPDSLLDGDDGDDDKGEKKHTVKSKKKDDEDDDSTKKDEKPTKKATTAKSENSKTDDSKSSDKKDEGLHKEKEKTESNERRKIIPEEVVDKILEKFQQLREEAKNMAMLEAKHDVEKDGGDGKKVKDEAKKPSPEPAKKEETNKPSPKVIILRGVLVIKMNLP
jgi:flagellar biosynthesis GTPase FlhF